MVWKLVNERLPSQWSFAAKLAALISSVLSLWFAGAAFIVLVLERGLQIRPIVLGTSFIVIHLIFGILVLLLSHANAPKGANKPSVLTLIIRGLAATSSIFIGSIVARTHPSLGGFVSCFPVIYLTTMIGVWVTQGEKVAAGAAGPMVLGGLSVSLYAYGYGLLYAHFGWLSAALMSYLFAVLCWSVPLAFFLRWYTARLARSDPKPTPTASTVDPIQQLYELDEKVFGKDVEEGNLSSSATLPTSTESEHESDSNVVKLDI